ncbi:ABC transporter ATP-binding protein [Cellulomonas sp. P22]|uniref:ABC transporter ATP-binding protein n=1 Tax=Cellulomonas sp. P22 TaxID=3373189 RepID=UPI003790154B
MDGLTIDAVSVRYGDVRRGSPAQAPPAVDAVSLDVARGEVLALLGPSGCGKSSLLRAVAGLEPLAAGTVSWDGADLAGVPVHRRGFGLMFQDGQLFPHRDVGGNVAFGLRTAGVPRAEREARVAELLDVVGLAGYARRGVATLSGGERQRVALARALAPRPRLLLLDEPLSALDRALRERLADDLRAALLATGTTALFVTHDHDEASTVGDRVGVMGGGRLLQVAPPAELWRAPATREVAEFLGYEAFVAAGSPVGTALTGAVVSGAGRTTETVGAGAASVLALAPGALVLAPDAAGAVVRGEVLGVAFRRGHAELAVRVEGVGHVTAVAPAGATCAPGEHAAFALDAGSVAFLR